VKTNVTDLRNFDQEGLIRFVEGLGQPAFRGRQMMSWLYRPGITEISQMTDLAKSFRAILEEHAFISRFSNPILEKSTDGTVKFGFRLFDGHIIESVLIPEPDRNTLCISSQAGCAMHCSFCLTGTMGFTRNLSPAEIVNQVCAARDHLAAEPEETLIGPRAVTNLVYMGMGEPLNNLENVLTSLSILTDHDVAPGEGVLAKEARIAPGATRGVEVRVIAILVVPRALECRDIRRKRGRAQGGRPPRDRAQGGRPPRNRHRVAVLLAHRLARHVDQRRHDRDRSTCYRYLDKR